MLEVYFYQAHVGLTGCFEDGQFNASSSILYFQDGPGSEPEPRKRAEYCFESTVSEERTH